MPDQSLQIGGLHSQYFPSGQGILEFGTWDQGVGQYNSSTNIIIATPGVSTINSIQVNGQPAGIFTDGETNILRGFAWNINNGNGLPEGGEQDKASLGVVNLQTFTSTYPDGNNNPEWSELSNNLGGLFNTDGTNNQELPGNPNLSEVYTVIMHSSPSRGAERTLSSQWGMRITYNVAEGGLAAWVMKNVKDFSNDGYNPTNWTLTAGDTDELAAAHLLVNGYGLLLSGQQIFWEVAP